ncbi:MFS general substrate transporter [Clathrospora elynae]|uniref:MFS general substrate transporter n=1 Tax=Clathrospora elynae TaxID=706981 RepID=A0A6A5SGT3_9PLEO|nr:MFS general substrate transporter [Clathrospora elynae]
MDEKPSSKRHARSSNSSNSNESFSNVLTHTSHPDGQRQSSSKKDAEEERSRIDALPQSPNSIPTPSFAHLDEKAVLRKMDLRLLPTLSLLYLLSFLDRGNIGNAKIEGLTEDLNMSGSQYNWCLTVFFFTYSVFEIPSNLLLKKIRPSIWLPTIMVAWGVVMTLIGIVQSYEGLLVARLFLGAAEAGLFPGVVFYITMWYTRDEAQFRQAVFISSASMAGAFSGLLAFGIGRMDGVANLAGWRWIFIIEGILTVLVAILAFFTLYDFPETAGFLTEEERAFVVYRLKYQGQKEGGVRVAQDHSFQWKFVKAAFLDWQVWTAVWVNWGIVCPLYGISLFLPTIIRNLGFSSSTAQLLTVPIYVTASAAAVVVAWYSDRVGKRFPFLLACFCVMTAGFIMCIAGGSVGGLVYAGVFIAACGLYPALPGIVTWLSNNLAGSTKRATGQAIQIAVGNLGGAMASNFYREEDAPHYLLGHALELGFILAGMLALFVLVFNYKRINAKRERQMAEGAHNGYTPEELGELGDRAITFKYVL